MAFFAFAKYLLASGADKRCLADKAKRAAFSFLSLSLPIVVRDADANVFLNNGNVWAKTFLFLGRFEARKKSSSLEWRN